MKNVVFVDGTRTAFGRLGGGLRQFEMSELAGIAIKGLVDKTGILERGGKVDAVFMGCALGDGRSNNIARYATLYAGLPYETSASFMEMQCGSAINCINHAAYQIMAGDADVIIAGGGESYSRMFSKFSMAVEPYKLIPPSAMPSRLAPNKEDQLTMIQISDKMAEKWGVTREECDAFALRSQTLAAKAIEAGYFTEEIVPVVIPATKKTPEIVIDKDEHPRATTMEGLAKLKPVQPDGVTTAGNASGRNDGGACVLMMTEEKARELGYTPIARWVAGADCGVDPKYMGIGPAFSNTKLLKKVGLRCSDIDVFECNEAFAAQNLSVIREMEKQMDESINMDNWNPNGGAIAYGHANGASGCRIGILTMKELQRRNGRYGLFSSCCGGGLGVSTLIERI